MAISSAMFRQRDAEWKRTTMDPLNVLMLLKGKNPGWNIGFDDLKSPIRWLTCQASHEWIRFPGGIYSTSS